MPGRVSDLDRLIEQGLDKYGSGDIDGALLSWEQALAIDPENAQANSYVDYVRDNYELLVDGSVRTDPDSYGISDDPEYQIEIIQGKSASAIVPLPATTAEPEMYVDPTDAGWGLEQEEATRERPPTAPVELVLEADEPPLPRAGTGGGLSFDETTREYQSMKDLGAAEFAPEGPTTEFHQNGEFGGEHTPVSFSDKTDVRKRDLGFVTPRAATEEALPPLAVPPPPVEVHFRTPKQPTSPPPVIAAPAAETAHDDGVGDAPTIAVTSAPTVELTQQQSADLQSRVPTQDLPTLMRPPRPDDPIAVGAPTRELGLRPGGRPPTNTDDEAPTRESDARGIRDYIAQREKAASAPPPVNGPFDARAQQILADLDRGAPSGEDDEARMRRRIGALFDRANAYNGIGETEKAVLAVDLALDEEPTSALAQKLIHRNRDTAMNVFQSYLGDLERQPQLARPLHELSSTEIGPRAAFLLSRIDGTLSLDEVLDVCGMPRMEAYRYLCQLFLRGILK